MAIHIIISEQTKREVIDRIIEMKTSGGRDSLILRDELRPARLDAVIRAMMMSAIEDVLLLVNGMDPMMSGKWMSDMVIEKGKEEEDEGA